ncbi:hypothetical protein CTEN210_05154 [Chaetoceros tenuissimus]|uniref:Protein ENHANCED DISEASE RESISTANCE 2 C-terminal domain-containing protein n=1 Tax=Chaetoceros tenuissimus TaxID=426638 RepID=A0AAD3H3G1_9STRA|nr:hypothetical protein CTEN210_05154 [Chaetoceros tenuissimus]
MENKKKLNPLHAMFRSCSGAASFSSEDEEYNSDELNDIALSHRSGIIGVGIDPILPMEPKPLDEKYWAEPDAQSFHVRGPTYVKDRIKMASADSLFRLFAVDLLKVEKPIMKDDMSILNAEDESSITPFHRLAKDFFFGESNDYRDSTFKLIPRIVDGNFVVKKAVGSKPTILGKKVKQHYIRSDRFLELIVDVGSDKIAKKVVGLSVGYAKTLVVDMGFVLEGKNSSCLPENMMGTVRLTNIDFKDKLRTVNPY